MTNALTQHKGSDNDQPQLKLSAEAAEYLDGLNLTPQKRLIVETRVMAKLWEEAFWHSDCRTSKGAVLRQVLETSVTIEQVREAVDYLNDPACAQKSDFLNQVCASNGNPQIILDAYVAREIWEKENGALKFEERDTEPFNRSFDKVLGELLDQAFQGNPDAQIALRKIVDDLSEAELKNNPMAWVARSIENRISRREITFTMKGQTFEGDMGAMMFKEMVRKDRKGFYAALKGYLNGESQGQIGMERPALPRS